MGYQQVAYKTLSNLKMVPAFSLKQDGLFYLSSLEM